MFPEGNNLNLLILVVVGASATASLLVGGLVFALARRTKACQAKKVNKLQLSDDVEDRGKLQEEYKVSSSVLTPSETFLVCSEAREKIDISYLRTTGAF